MTRSTITVPADMVELLDDASLSLQDFARCARLAPEWVQTHVQAGVLQPASGGGATEWRFASTTVVRARRIAELEHIYDADPQLAGLTADLIEEVAALRRAMQRLAD